MCFFVFSTLFLHTKLGALRSTPHEKPLLPSTTMLRATSIARRLTAPVLRTRQTRSDGCGDTEWGARVGTVWHTGRRRHDDVRATHPNRAHGAPPPLPPYFPPSQSQVGAASLLKPRALQRFATGTCTHRNYARHRLPLRRRMEPTRSSCACVPTVPARPTMTHPAGRLASAPIGRGQTTYTPYADVAARVVPRAAGVAAAGVIGLGVGIIGYTAHVDPHFKPS